MEVVLRDPLLFDPTMKRERSFLNAVKWAYSANWGDRAFSALFTFILAAILGPRDFGLVSIGLIYLSFMQMFLDQGLVAALIQRQELKQQHCDAVFWMNLFLSLLLVGLTVLLSGWWARINHAPDLAQLLSVMSLSIPLEGLSIVQSALLRRDMDFKSLSIRSNVSVLIGGVAGIAMALAGFRAWSLVGQQLVRDFSALLLLWKLGNWRPRLEFSWMHLKDLMGFSVHNFVAQLGIFADMQAGSVLLGVLFGPVAVGLYRLADRLMNSVVVMATSSIQSVSLPEFSRVQDQPEELRKSALSCIRLSATVTVPALACMAVVSGPLMATLGSRWVAATDVLRVLCLLGMSLVLSYFTGPLLQALGRTKQLAILEWARMAVGMGFLVVTAMLVKNASVNWQVTGIALARFVPTVLLVTPFFVYILMHFCRLSGRDLVSATAPSMLSAAGILISVFLLQQTGIFAANWPVVTLASQVLVGGSFGLVILLGMDRNLRGALWRMVSGMRGSATLFK
jgi:PST family polysaccharide transporter